MNTACILQSHCKECMARLHTNWRKKRPEVMAPAVESKVCGGCNKEKPASEFYADRKRRDGLQCQCKACTSQHHERWRAKKREEVGESSAWHASIVVQSGKGACLRVWCGKAGA